MSERVAKVRRTLIVEYDVPVSSYPGMDEEEIAYWEKDGDNLDPSQYLEFIKSEDVEVTFSGDPA